MVGGKCDIGSSAVPDLFDQVPVVVVGYNLDVDLFGIISRYKGVDFSVKAVAQGAVFAYGKKTYRILGVESKLAGVVLSRSALEYVEASFLFTQVII